jgi:hypothetical protein
LETNDEERKIELISTFSTPVKSVFWEPLKSEKAIGLSDNGIQLLDINSGIFDGFISFKENLHSGRYDPRNTDQIGLVSGRDVFGYDLLSGKESFRIKDADRVGLKDFDFNPNCSYQLATGGLIRVILTNSYRIG